MWSTVQAVWNANRKYSKDASVVKQIYDVYEVQSVVDPIQFNFRLDTSFL